MTVVGGHTVPLSSRLVPEVRGHDFVLKLSTHSPQAVLVHFDRQHAAKPLGSQGTALL